jgi:hypothetical protein
MFCFSKKCVLVLTFLIAESKGSAALSTNDYLEFKLKETKEVLIEAYIKARAFAEGKSEYRIHNYYLY